MGSLVPVHVTRLAPGERPCHAVVVIATVVGDRRLGFTIPAGEATRLAGALGLAPHPSPSPICDLVLGLMRRFDAAVNQAVIDLNDGAVTAHLLLTHGRAPFALTCHPADALTLAVRAGAPIFATAALLAIAHATGDEAAVDAADAVQRWLDGVSPDDFGALGA